MSGGLPAAAGDTGVAAKVLAQPGLPPLPTAAGASSHHQQQQQCAQPRSASQQSGRNA